MFTVIFDIDHRAGAQGAMALQGHPSSTTGEEWTEDQRRCAKLQWVRPENLLVNGARDGKHLSAAQADVWRHVFSLWARTERDYRVAQQRGQLDRYIMVRTKHGSRSLYAVVDVVSRYSAVLQARLGDDVAMRVASAV